MRKLIIVCFAVVTILGSAGAFAGGEPFQASITPDLAIHDRDVRIEGLSLNIWGENPQTALSLGFVNGSTGRSAGLSWAFLLNYAEEYKGIQWAPVNYTRGDFLGWQDGFINYTGGHMVGFQNGFLNYAHKFSGLQLGVLNVADMADTGLQIGFVNVIGENEWFTELPNELAPGMVIVNWRF